MQIDIHKPTSFIKKYLPWLIVIALSVFLFLKTTSVSELKEANKALVKEAIVKDSIAKSHIAKYDSIEVSRQEITEKLIAITAKYEQSEKEKSILRKERDEKIKDADSYRVSDMQRWWDENYRPANQSSAR